MRWIVVSFAVWFAGCAGSEGSESGSSERLTARGECEWAVDRGVAGEYEFETYADGHVESRCPRDGTGWKCTDRGVTIDRSGDRLTASGGADIGCKVWTYDANGTERMGTLDDVLR